MLNDQQPLKGQISSAENDKESSSSKATNKNEYDIGTDNVQRNILWEKYQMHIDLYKFYMEQLIKLQVFYYGITGGIFTYYFAHGSQIQATRYSFLLPLIMSVFFAFFYLFGVSSLRGTTEEVYRIARALKFIQANNIGVLSIFLMIFAALSLVVALVCIGMIIVNPAFSALR